MEILLLSIAGILLTLLVFGAWWFGEISEQLYRIQKLLERENKSL